jgi:hypothetical protein
MTDPSFSDVHQCGITDEREKRRVDKIAYLIRNRDGFRMTP